MNKTSIEWTDFTWNPVTGCNKVSQGCKNCYAETLATRFWGKRKFTDVIMHEDRLNEPAKNTKKWAGKKVFVCSMSDLFHESVTFEFIVNVWRCFADHPQTTFQLLTKRPERALEFMKWAAPVFFNDKLQSKARAMGNQTYLPLPNIWIGTSCEDQATANERIPLLLQIPAAVRFLSCEPLLGPIDFHFQSNCMDYNHADFGCPGIDDHKLHWIIAGGESGHGARPMHPAWVRLLRDQCAHANVPFFFKQWGEYVPIEFNENLSGFTTPANNSDDSLLDGVPYSKVVHSETGLVDFVKIGKSKSGALLDGIEHRAFPV